MKNIYILLLTLWCGIAVAQSPIKPRDLNKKWAKRYAKAKELGASNQTDKAIALLDKILKKHPNLVDAQLLKASIYYHDKDYDRSIQAFDKAIDKYPDYNNMAYFSKAIAQRAKDDHSGAKASLQVFLEKAPDHNKAKRAKDLLSHSTFAADLMARPVPYDPVLLHKANTTHLEYAPVMSVEGSAMIFTRRIRGQEDFYKATIQEDTIVDVQPIEELNTPYNEGVHTTSADGRTMIYTACDRKKENSGCDLFIRRYVDGRWTEEVNMGDVVNSHGWDAQPSLSANGKILVFSSNRIGGQGGKDLWITARTDSTGWSTPMPLSKTINTKGDEESPYFHPDGRTLYFRSNKHPGMGGFDIFYTQYNFDKKDWDEPTNIGYPINTRHDEGALSVSLDGKTGYFASDQIKQSARRNLDLYKFDLPQHVRPDATTYARIRVEDASTGIPLACNYTISNLSKDFVIDSGRTTDGYFISAVPVASEYACIIEKEGYVYHSEHFKWDSSVSALNPIERTIKLHRVKPAKSTKAAPESRPVVMQNIFFDTGKSTLKPASKTEISALYDLLTNTDIKVQIMGHTDDIGSTQDNVRLSQDRANAVKSELVRMGIPAHRIEAVGLGESQPIADNTTAEGRATNRRTEFKIIE